MQDFCGARGLGSEGAWLVASGVLVPSWTGESSDRRMVVGCCEGRVQVVFCFSIWVARLLGVALSARRRRMVESHPTAKRPASAWLM